MDGYIALSADVEKDVPAYLMSTVTVEDAKKAYVEHRYTADESVPSLDLETADQRMFFAKFTSFPDNLTLDVYKAFSTFVDMDEPAFLTSTIKEEDAKQAYTGLLKFKDAVKAHPDPNIFCPREQQQLKAAAAIQAEVRHRKYLRGQIRKYASRDELLALSLAQRRRFGLTPAFLEQVLEAES